MVSAELAVAFPVVTVVLALVLAAVNYGMTQVRCVDAARTAARMVARGDALDTARGTALRGLPSGAAVGIDVSGADVVVRVSAASWAVSWLGVPPARSEAVAARESGGDDA
nr:TadE family type IV pilus minor pilin [Tetrasphaera japonica]